MSLVKPIRIGPVEVASPVILAPMTAVTDLPFRRAVKRYGAGLTEGVVQAAIDAGRIARQPAKPLAHLLLGALDEAALYVATAEDAAAARAEVGTVLDRLMAALTAS